MKIRRRPRWIAKFVEKCLDCNIIEIDQYEEKKLRKILKEMYDSNFPLPKEIFEIIKEMVLDDELDENEILMYQMSELLKPEIELLIEELRKEEKSNG